MAKRKSIMQDRETGQCYLCRLLHGDYSIKPVRQEHHVMGGTANRRLSESTVLRCGSTRIITSTARKQYIETRKWQKYSTGRRREPLRGITRIWTSWRSSGRTI